MSKGDVSTCLNCLVNWDLRHKGDIIYLDHHGKKHVGYPTDSINKGAQPSTTTTTLQTSIMSCKTIFQILLFLRSFTTVLSFGCPPPERLRRLLTSVESGEAPILLLPCCYDGLTARLVALSGFDATFMTGFGVSGKFYNFLL